MTALLNGMKDSSQFYTNGVHVAGVRYIYLSGSDAIVRARKGTDGVHCTKTNQGIQKYPDFGSLGNHLL